VKQCAHAVGIVMSPHGMQASFIKLAFEGGADLAQVQDGARHKDPQNTRRYQKRRNNLHKNAIDFVRIE
jgi:integrase/recombinase XerD